jgi:hypothetical protein
MNTTHHPNGSVASIVYKQYGRSAYHRIDGPAIRKWNVNGVLIKESWYQNGHRHRDNGPAYRNWNNDGALTEEGWWQNGFLHRDNAPAYQQWNDAGRLIEEEWWQNSRVHRDNGPAYQKWNDIGVLVKEGWWRAGYYITPQEVEKILRPADIMAAIWTLPQPIAEEIAAVYRAV